MTRLETQRLILRPVEWRDAEAIVELIGNFNVSKTLSRVPHPYSKQDAIDFLTRRLGRDLPENDIAFAIELKSGPDHLIGCMGVHPERAEEEGDLQTAEIGYWLGEPYWGQRIMSETAACIVAYAFEVLGLQRLVGGCMVGNDGSRKILQGLGFWEFGIEKRSSAALGEDVDCHMMELSREQWDVLTIPAPPGVIPAETK